MALLDTIRRGESLTIAVALPESYNTARINELEIVLGSKVYAHTLVDHLITVKLTSEDTSRLSGLQELTVMLNDSTIGVTKTPCGTINVASTYSRYSSTATSSLNTITVTLIITEATVSVDSVLYNFLIPPICGDNKVLLSSPNGTAYQVTVTNAGELLVETI